MMSEFGMRMRACARPDCGRLGQTEQEMFLEGLEAAPAECTSMRDELIDVQVRSVEEACSLVMSRSHERVGAGGGAPKIQRSGSAV